MFHVWLIPYWLANETRVSHTTLRRLKKGKALGIKFITLAKLSEALDCQNHCDW